MDVDLVLMRLESEIDGVWRANVLLTMPDQSSKMKGYGLGMIRLEVGMKLGPKWGWLQDST
jgi:hypothetical protein